MLTDARKETCLARLRLVQVTLCAASDVNPDLLQCDAWHRALSNVTTMIEKMKRKSEKDKL